MSFGQRERMIKKYGSLEAWEEYHRQISSLGGKARVPKGFARMDPEKVKVIGAKGGRGRKGHKYPRNV